MKKRKYFENKIAPDFLEKGYIYENPPLWPQNFYSADRNIRVEFDLLERQPYLRLYFALRYGDRSAGIRANDLIGVDDPDLYEIRFLSDDEFKQAVRTLSDCALHVVLPVLEQVNLWTVTFQRELFEILAKDPEGRARDFAERNRLDMSCSEENLLWIKSWLIRQFPEDPIIRDYVFQENIETFMGLIAYRGELWRNKIPCSSQWGWFPSPNGRFAEPEGYGVNYDGEYNGEPAADFLSEFVYCWNFYGVLKGPFAFIDF